MAMNRIKAVLAEKQLTSKWLAAELGKAENTVSRWCSKSGSTFIRGTLGDSKDSRYGCERSH